MIPVLKQTLVSRARMKVLWLKHAYPINWAHKPLCERFECDVIRICKVHLCRSCTLVYSGLVAGMGFCAASPALGISHDVVAGGAILLAVGVFAPSWPPFYGRLSRGVRDLLRTSLGLLLAMTVYISIVLNPALGIGALLSMVLLRKVYARRRAREKKKVCQGCPELGKGICSGYALQAERIRAYEEEATALLYGRVSQVPRQSGRVWPTG